MKSALCPSLKNVKRLVEELQTSSSHMVLRRGWFQCESLPGSWLNTSKISRLFFFFPPLRIMLRSCSKLKVNLSIKRPCSQQAGSFFFFLSYFFFFLKKHCTLYILIKTTAWLLRYLDRFTVQWAACVSEGAAQPGPHLCTGAKGAHEAGEQWWGEP